ncbi:MAG: hypothetical protein JO340_02150 [Acidobacteriaceae bacterium]|nr:hypothetical protein [Acidobacteriaceae bacterium]
MQRLPLPGERLQGAVGVPSVHAASVYAVRTPVPPDRLATPADFAADLVRHVPRFFSMLLLDFGSEVLLSQDVKKQSLPQVLNRSFVGRNLRRGRRAEQQRCSKKFAPSELTTRVAKHSGAMPPAPAKVWFAHA